MLKLAWKYMRYYKSQTFAIFASILLTASLLSGISSLIYSSQKSDLANSKTIYGDWHYYIETDVLQFLHYTTNIPNLVLNGIMVLNVVIAVVAVMFPAWKMGKENIISEIRR